jgi:hypothetical protein
LHGPTIPQPHTNNNITTTTPPHHHSPPSPLPPPPPPPSFTLPPWDEAADKNGVIYEEWEVALLKLLPKKGDLSLCKNWRGICLLDVLSKIVSTVMNARMAIVQEDNGLEAQTGFRSNRGTIDGTFSINIALQKRKEHGLATWALFIDLVKAFDTIIREAAFTILRKFGFPDHFIHIAIRLHKNASIKFKTGAVDSSVPSSIGVRQGSVEGPSIFLFFMQAVMETAEWPVPKPEFCTRENGETQGASSFRKYADPKARVKLVDRFQLWASLFADDCGLLFNTREDMIIASNYIYHHLLRFGMRMHIGRGLEASKTEAMYCPPRGETPYEGATATDGFNVDDGYITFTSKFKYLGSITHQSLTTATDVNARIGQARAAFGALRKDVFANKHIENKLKGKLYNAFVLQTLLHGSESWSMTELLLKRLRVFHNNCARAMCRVTMFHTIKHHIHNSDLHHRLSIQSLDHYYNSRLLRWAGHVARMDMTRIPRNLLTGWVEHHRPTGCPPVTFGRTLKKALVAKGLPVVFTD